MLTARGWWFLIVVIGLLAVAGLTPPHGHLPLILVGLTLLFWGIAEWFLFAVRLRVSVPGLILERELRDEGGRVANLWAGRTFEVRVRLRLASGLRLPYVIAADRVPFGCELIDGVPRWEGAIASNEPAEFAYRIRCAGTGQVRFEGAALQLADVQGFFYHRTFLHTAELYRVLPVLGNVDSHHTATKHFNLMLPPGIHRHRRPGSGSELLDLRDYLPGDPPKMIAWKVSARRDRLITKEFENDVPIRCTLLVDTSNSVRLGPANQTALTRLVEIAAAVAQSAIGNRDPVGLGLFDEQTVQYLKPARTRRQLTEMLNRLADAAGREPSTGEADVDTLVPLAHGFVQEVYPQLLRSEINAFPPWLPWLWPRSVWTIPRPRFGDFLYWLFPILVLAITYLFIRLSIWIWLTVAQWLQPLSAGIREQALLTLVLVAVILLLLLIRVLTLLFPQRRRLYRWRKQLAAILSVHYGLSPAGVGLLLEDDRQMSRYLQHFLAEHRVPMPLPLYDKSGRYLFAAPEKVDVLAQVLLQAVGKGHDNEMFVLLADLLELTDQLGPLLRAVKVTLARHHQVLVICPWPPGIPPPKKERPGLPGVPALDPALARASLGSPMDQTILAAATERFHAAFFQLRRTFARLGVPVICAQGEEPARLIVERLDRLRTVRSGPRR